MMRPNYVTAILGALALGTLPALASAQTTSAGTATPATSVRNGTAVYDPIDIRRWSRAELRGAYSGERLLDTTARGDSGKKLGEVANFLIDAEGRISGVIIESQGFLEVGDTHFFVPWQRIRLGPDLAWVQVPVNERNLADFSLFNGDESIYKPDAVIRGNELLGEFVRLEGGVPYGYVDDVIFSKDGRVQSIVVAPDYRYGYGVYAYPYRHGWNRLGYYDMPYSHTEISALKPFDYVGFDIATDSAMTTGAGDTMSSDATRGSDASGRTYAATPAAQAGISATKVEVHPSADYGAHLTDGQGRALYLFTADMQGQGGGSAASSDCYEACAQVWPPLLATGSEIAIGTQVEQNLVGALQRKDGSMQVTYNGWPLYYYVKDAGPGQATGHDVQSFGGGWYLLMPQGDRMHARQ